MAWRHRSRWELTPERALWLLCTIFGVSFLLVTPPHDPADEVRHYARAFLISEGRLSMVGRRPGYEATIPRSIVHLHPPLEHHTPDQLAFLKLRGRRRARPHSAGEILAKLRLPLTPDQRQPARYLSGYSPVPYAHQAAAVWVGRKLGLSAAGILYLARFANLAVFLCAVATALRLSPIRRWTLAMLALAPAALFQAASVSADPPTNAIAFVLVGLGWRAAYGGENRLRAEERWAFIAACALLGLAKPGYWPLAGLAFAVPARRFNGRGAHVSWVSSSIAAATLPSLAWLLCGLWVDPALVGEHTDPRTQIVGILNDPLGYLTLLGATFVRTAPYYVMGCVGWLGHHEVRLPMILYVAFPLAVMATALLDRPDPRSLTRGARGVAAALFALGCSTMMTLAYLAWNPVGAPAVYGVQGRYFIPLLPLLAVLLPARGWLSGHRFDGLYAGVATVTLALALVGVIRQYYYP